MDSETARALCAVNKHFYQQQCASFSATRTAPWEGWRRCLAWARRACRTADPADKQETGGTRGPAEHAADEGTRGAASERADIPQSTLSVLDVACGNLRFEAFLAEALTDTDLIFHTVDDCDALVESVSAGSAAAGTAAKGAPEDNTGAEYARAQSTRIAQAGTAALDGRKPRFARHHRSLDVLAALDAADHGGPSLAEALQIPPCDLAVSFGFMHHIPLPRWREEALAALAKSVRPGGFAIVSFWRFLEDPRLARKAAETHRRALSELGLPKLDESDRLLGWKDAPRAYRYCHSFTDGEIDALAASAAGIAEEAARFRADGRDGNLNSYLVLHRLE